MSVLLDMAEEKLPWSPPKWVEPFSPVRVQQGSQAVFAGRVSGCPIPSLSWTWQGRPVQEWVGRGKACSHHHDWT